MAGQSGHSLLKGSLVKPSPCICHRGLMRACKSTKCMQISTNALQKQARVQGRRSKARHHRSVVLSAAAPQDVIDVDATVVDNRIPVTVSEPLNGVNIHNANRIEKILCKVRWDTESLSFRRSSLVSWGLARPPC